jgi:hypothetical protein
LQALLTGPVGVLGANQKAAKDDARGQNNGLGGASLAVRVPISLITRGLFT